MTKFGWLGVWEIVHASQALLLPLQYNVYKTQSHLSTQDHHIFPHPPGYMLASDVSTGSRILTSYSTHTHTHIHFSSYVSTQDYNFNILLEPYDQYNNSKALLISLTQFQVSPAISTHPSTYLRQCPRLLTRPTKAPSPNHG